MSAIIFFFVVFKVFFSKFSNKIEDTKFSTKKMLSKVFHNVGSVPLKMLDSECDPHFFGIPPASYVTWRLPLRRGASGTFFGSSERVESLPFPSPGRPWARGRFWYSRGIRVVSAWYPRGIRVVFAWYSRSIHPLGAHCALRGAHFTKAI